MRTIETEYLTPADIDRAAALIAAGEIVAFATETVYGLGADSLNPTAIEKVFRAKGRPSNNPLIVHVHDASELERVVSQIPPIAKPWMDQLWPGPLTIVMPKHSSVPTAVSAGLETVGVRVPNHDFARELIRRSGQPIAAPSANRSGKPSATTWQAVAEDLDGWIAAIVCDDPSAIGLESTVVDATVDPPTILRQGGITLEQLRSITPSVIVLDGSVPRETAASPGLLHRHYQPNAKIQLLTSIDDHRDPILQASADKGLRMAYIGLQPPHGNSWEMVHVCQTIEQYAAQLFDFFRQADRTGIDVICCQVPPSPGIGAAIQDRLRRAAQT